MPDKIIGYGINIVKNNLDVRLAQKLCRSKYDCISKAEPVFKQESNKWSFETVEGEKVFIDNCNVDVIRWVPVYEDVKKGE
jgi:hypothetical protein